MTAHTIFTGWIILKKKARHTQKEIIQAFDNGDFCRTKPTERGGWYIGKHEKAYKCTIKMVDMKKKNKQKGRKK